MDAPLIIKPIPAQVVNELASFAPFDLKPFFQVDDACQFSAALQTGESLPKGMICTSDGFLTGIPAKGTVGNYEVVLTVQDAAGSVEATFTLVVKPSLAASATELGYLDELKAQVWQAIDQHLPIPDLTAMLERAVTPLDIYYLIERFGTLTIYDAFNLDTPGEKVPLQLAGASPHYHVFDRGSCLIACPKELFSHERTLEDGLKTARALAREVYTRDWTMEFVGFDKFTRAAWVELQHLGDKHGKRPEIINFNPTTNDLNLYTMQAIEKSVGQQPESDR